MIQSNARPFPIKLFNWLRIPTNLDAEQLMQLAQKKTGLNSFGEYDVFTPLNLLLASINEEAKLHPFGRFITKQRIVNVLMNRLRAEDLIAKHPEILEIEINNPIIITGLQRTGTTRLHRLLSAHKNVRSLQSWEALNPAPISGDANDKQRKKFAKTAEKALRFMSPDFFAIHPVEYESPEEDILLNDMSFVSTVPEATMNVPTYAAWVQQQSHLPAYRYLKRMLQVLTWQNPNERWVLKTPQYLEFLSEAYEVFPDAKVIHTYRDPLKVVPSFSSMLYHSYRVFSDEVKPATPAKHWMIKDEYMLQKAMKFWEDNPQLPVKHVSYYDMMQNTVETMKEIYAFSNLEVDSEVLQQLRDKNQSNQQHKYGVHKYHLEDFDLTRDEVNERFAQYRTKYNIPYE